MFDTIYSDPENAADRVNLKNWLSELNQLDTSKPLSAAKTNIRVLVTILLEARVLYLLYSIILYLGQTAPKGITYNFYIYLDIVSEYIALNSCLIQYNLDQRYQSNKPLKL